MIHNFSNGCARFFELSHFENRILRKLCNSALNFNSFARIWNVIPNNASDYFLNSINSNSKHGSKFVPLNFAIGIKSSYLKNLSFGKLCISCFRTSNNFFRMGIASACNALSLPILRNHVGMIIQNRSSKQMLGITARRIVATMTGKNSVINMSIHKLERDSVSQFLLPVNSNDSVVVFVSASSPNPTGVIASGFINVLPDYFRRIFRSSHVWNNTTITNLNAI